MLAEAIGTHVDKVSIFMGRNRPVSPEAMARHAVASLRLKRRGGTNLPRRGTSGRASDPSLAPDFVIDKCCVHCEL